MISLKTIDCGMKHDFTIYRRAINYLASITRELMIYNQGYLANLALISYLFSSS